MKYTGWCQNDFNVKGYHSLIMRIKSRFSHFLKNLEKKSVRWTVPSCGIDRAARHAGGFRRFDPDSGGECGHLLINK
jgi:hypothetical protein